MIVLLAAAALAASDAPTAAPSAVDPAALERLYTQSCGERAYASFDDVCNTLRIQIDRYRKEEAQRQRAEKAHPKPAKTAAADPTTTDSSAQKP